MSTFRAGNATIQLSIDGERWHNLMQATALSMVPWAQAQASTLAQVEAAKERARPMGHAIGTGIVQGYTAGIRITRWNDGAIDAIAGLHTRRAMRHRKLRRYVAAARKTRA